MKANNLPQATPNRLFDDVISYLAVYFTIALSGIFTFIAMGRTALMIFLPILYLAKRPKLKINTFMLIYLVYFFIIVLLQDMSYGSGLSTYNIIMWSVRLFLPIVIGLSLRDKFLEIYVRVMRALALISLAIFVIVLIFPQVGALFVVYGAPADIIDSTYSTFFYSYTRPNPNNAYQIFDRLSGPFTEPGLYAFFLILGLMFNYFLSKKFVNFTGILLMVSLLLTQSTAGYLSLFFIFLYSIYLTRYRLLSWVFLIVIVVGSIYVYRLPFMKFKIEEQRYIASTSRLDEARRGRGHQAVKSIFAFGRHFVFGAGLTYESQQGLSDADLSGFSLLDIGRQSGLIGLTLYCFGLLSFLLHIQKRYTGTNSLIGVMFLFTAIAIVLSAQQVLYFRTILLVMIFIGFRNYSQLKHPNLKSSN